MNPLSTQINNSLLTETEGKEKEIHQNILELAYLEDLSHNSSDDEERIASNAFLSRLYFDASNMSKNREFFNKIFFELSKSLGLRRVNINIDKITIRLLKQNGTCIANFLLGLIYNFGIGVIQSNQEAYYYYGTATIFRIAQLFTLRFPQNDNLSDDQRIAAIKDLSQKSLIIAKFYWFKFAKSDRFNVLNKVAMLRLYSPNHFSKLKIEVDQQYNLNLTLPPQDETKLSLENKKRLKPSKFYKLTKEDEKKFDRAQAFMRQNKINKALPLYKELTAKGHSYSQLNLAMIYIESKDSLQKNIQEGIKLLENVIENTKAELKLLECKYGNIQSQEIEGENIQLPQMMVDCAMKGKELEDILGLAEYNLGVAYLIKLNPPNHEKGFNCFNNSYKHHYLFSAEYLGFCHRSGWGTTINHCLAFKYFEKGANLPNDYKEPALNSMFYLGEYYSEGIEGFLEVNIKKAIYWFSLAARSEQFDADFKLSQIYSGILQPCYKNNKLALKHLLIASKKGCNNATALYIHHILMNPRNDSDYNHTFNLTKELINKGHPSHFLLAEHYAKGKGIEKNLIEAARNYELSISEEGTVKPYRALIDIHHMQQNYHLSEHWASKAIEIFDDPYALYYKYSYNKLDHRVSINRVETLSLLKRSAEKKYAPALYELGRLYYFGAEDFDIPENKILGLDLLKQAAESNILKAIATLAFIYMDISLEERDDYKNAFKWASLGAEQGDPECKFIMGLIYLNGLGRNKNFRLGLEWMQEASQEGYDSATKYLTEHKKKNKQFSGQQRQSINVIDNTVHHIEHKSIEEEKNKELSEYDIDNEKEVDGREENKTERKINSPEVKEKTNELIEEFKNEESNDFSLSYNRIRETAQSNLLLSLSSGLSNVVSELQYEASAQFGEWLDTLSTLEINAVNDRIKTIVENGHFGDFKFVSKGLGELRWTNGLRVYFMFNKNNIICLLGGKKQEKRQQKDINAAKLLRLEFLAKIKKR